ncbi:MAG: anthranilate phosphoribosyltransferase [Candidatus Sericytochromatia bacterium]|uniref:Anthranilate phosphoribosyltransferase n=1 Tax=Candidatus Tanganyikabacteria bacterium TaxID=2961651 RepID=A0A937X6N2_9BACT|nr:anthranilate phosphoribosyltransferase [Candidatus Tanganyikabacteria bacterium]
MAIREAIQKLVEHKSLSQDEASAVMAEMMEGQATPAQIGAFLVGLRLKTESVDEIVGLARVMRERAQRLSLADELVDTCGTGGDRSGTFNISTTAAFVVAGLGVKVAKHGNRAASSGCGSADVLEALGVKIALSPDGVRQCLEQVGIGFMFAQTFHPAMRHVAGPRREIGVRTVFNILGPLTNPAGASRQVIGVANPLLAPPMADALKLLGTKHSLLVCGGDGLDELSLSTSSTVWEVASGRVKMYSVAPDAAGLPRAPTSALAGGTPQENSAILQRVLEGEKGPRRDVVLLNAAAALIAADRAPDLREGVQLAASSIDSGHAREKLQGLVKLSQTLQ